MEVRGPAADRLREVLEDLKSSGADVKWVRPDHLHMTLAFLGELAPGRLETVIEAARRTASRHPQAALAFSLIDAFPSLKRPRTLWAGVRPGPGAARLERAAADLREELERGGFPPDKRGFVPHVTLGRVRKQRGLRPLLDRTARWREDRAWDGADFTARELTLIRSRLSSAGPEYSALERFPLAAGGGA